MKTIIESITEIKNFDFKNATQKEIEEALPTFGMNDEQTFEMPKEFEQYMGWGVKFWQYPNQFSKLLYFLKNKDISSYLEIGCRWGGTFIIMNELLRRYNPHLKAFANDFIALSDILHTYQNSFEGNKFTYLQMESNGPYFFYSLGQDISRPKPQVDLVFVDGNHLYWGIKEDYHRALSLGAKYIIFHDIASQSCPTAKWSWNEIKKNHKKVYEYTDQYDSVKGSYLGIGIVEVTKEDLIFPFFREYYRDLFGE